MKAKELLKWIVNNDVCTDSMGTVEVDEEFDFKGYFGYQPDGEVPEGEYAYLYSDEVTDVDMQRLGEQTDDQVYTITTDMDDKKNGGSCVIYLFRLEE